MGVINTGAENKNVRGAAQADGAGPGGGEAGFATGDGEGLRGWDTWWWLQVSRAGFGSLITLV